MARMAGAVLRLSESCPLLAQSHEREILSYQ